LAFGQKNSHEDEYYPDKKKFFSEVKEFFKDYEQYFEIVSIYGIHEHGVSEEMNTLMGVKAKVKDEDIIPLKIEIKP
jgi:hypothetical protein